MSGYQFSVLRYLHDVSAAEFVNVGVVAWSLQEPSIEVRLNERYSRASTFFTDFDGSLYRRYLRTIERRLADARENLWQRDMLQPQSEELKAALDEVMLEDDSAFQWSSLMGGITDDLSRRADELFQELVLRHEQATTRDRRDDADVGRAVDRVMTERGIYPRVGRGVEIRSEDYEYTFHAGWHNGVRQVLEPISFDYVRSWDVVEKANVWSGRLYNLSRGNEFGFTAIVAAPRDPSLVRAFERALSILRHAQSVRELVLEERVADIVPKIIHDLETAGGESGGADT